MAKASASKASKSTKYVYTWGNKKADGDGSMKPLLGGKGANLAEMTRIGLPVPPGFTITTEVCTYFYDHKKTYPPELQAQMEAGVVNMEKAYNLLYSEDRLTAKHSPPQIGADGKWQLNIYDPDGTRAEVMEFQPVVKPCCSEFTAASPTK